MALVHSDLSSSSKDPAHEGKLLLNDQSTKYISEGIGRPNVRSSLFTITPSIEKCI